MVLPESFEQDACNRGLLYTAGNLVTPIKVPPAPKITFTPDPRVFRSYCRWRAARSGRSAPYSRWRRPIGSMIEAGDRSETECRRISTAAAHCALQSRQQHRLVTPARTASRPEKQRFRAQVLKSDTWPRTVSSLSAAARPRHQTSGRPQRLSAQLDDEHRTFVWGAIG